MTNISIEKKTLATATLISGVAGFNSANRCKPSVCRNTNSRTHNMKRPKTLLLACLLALLCLASTGLARAEQVSIGDPETTSNSIYIPWYSNYDYSYTQQIYTAEEIGRAGVINSLTVWLYHGGNSNNEPLPTFNIDIYLKEVDKNSFSGTTDWVYVSSTDKVYTGTLTVANTTARAFTFTFDKSFTYSGQGNLLIAFDDNTGSYKYGLRGLVFSGSSDPNRTIYAFRDGTDYNPTSMGGVTANNTTYQRNVIELGMYDENLAYNQSITIGDLATASNSPRFPWHSNYDYSYTQQIYTADEIGTSGTINAVTMWLYHSGSNPLPTFNIDIYMKEVDKETFSGSNDWVSVSADDKVYCGSVKVTNTNAQAFTFTLATPFEYSGQGNLLIAFDDNTGSYKYGMNGMVFGESNDPFRAVYHCRDGSDYDPFNMTGITSFTLAQRSVVALSMTDCPSLPGLSTVTIGDPESTASHSVLPMTSTFNYSYTQQIFTAEEIGTACTVNTLTMWLRNNSTNILPTLVFDIYMREVDKDAFTSLTDWVSVSATDKVYSGTLTVTNRAFQSYTITLDIPFEYSGEGNLLIAFDENTGYWKSGLEGKVSGTEGDPIRTIYARRDGSDYDPLNISGVLASGTPYQRNVVELGIDIPCAAPTDLAIDTLGFTFATLSWIENGEATAWQICLNDDETNFIEADSNPFTLTDLTPGTTYSAKVRTYCDTTDQSDWSNSVAFTTLDDCPAPVATLGTVTATTADLSWTASLCEGYTVKYREKYTSIMGDTLLEEHFDGNGVPEGWYFQDGFSIISQTNHAGMAPNEVKMDGTMYPETFIQTPAIDLSGISQVNVSCRIDGLVIGPAYPGMSGFEMSISTSSDGGATWHNVSLGTFLAGVYSIGETIAIPDMGQSNVLFRINTDLKDRYIVFLDDIVMVGMPYGEWQDLHVTDTAVTLTGLNPNTVYDVKVVPDCNENKESEIVTFTTANPCETPTDLTVGNLTATTAELSWYGYSLTGYEVEYYTTAIIDEVFNEGFEGGTLPEGWTIEGDNQDPATTWRVGVGDSYTSTGTHSGDYNALITHNQNTDETFLVTPSLNLGAYDALELSFWYINRRQTYSINVFDFLSVYYRIGEEGEWNELWSTGFNRHPDWTHQTLTLTGLADNYQIGFMMYDRNGMGVGLDDIVITNFVAPAGEPMTLTVEEGTTATLTGLSANTAYEVRVKANCDAAEYCSPVVFTTSCNPITITAETPYTQDFESPEGSAYWIAGPLPPCWEGYSTGNVAPHNDNTFIINGSQSLSFYFGDNYAILPEFINPINELQISFMLHAGSPSGYSNHVGIFTLGYITADDDGTCNTFTEIITSEYDYYSSFQDPEPWNMDFSDVPADAHRLAFKWYGHGMLCNVDDLEVSINPCLHPYTITAETPYTQDFESPAGSPYWKVGYLPPCWEGYSTGNVAPHNSDYYMIINGSQSLSFYFGDNYAILPEFINPINELQISFMLHAGSPSGYSNHVGIFTLGYITADDDGTCNTFTEIITSEYDYYSSFQDPEPWNMDFSDVPADAHRLAFKWYGHGMLCNVDDLEVSINPCLHPYTITAETPYTQDFESPAGSPYWKVGYLPPCWEGYSTGNVAPHNSDYYMIINGSQSLSFYFGDNYAILPEFINPINELQISFMLHAGSPSGYSNHVGIFTLGYITADDDGTCNTFTEIITSEYDYYSSFQDPEPWNMDFSDVPADAHRLAFKWYGHGMLCNVDDLEVSATVSPTVTQTVELVSGWNWVSFNVETTLDDLKAALVEALPGTAISIKSQTQNTSYNPNNHRWVGSLAWDVAKMYMIKVVGPCEITIEGLPINPTEHPVSILNGVNWIGFPLNANMSLSNAFADFAANGDRIKSQTNNALYNGIRWQGQLNTLVPGSGYIYISNSEEGRTFIFPISTR